MRTVAVTDAVSLHTSSHVNMSAVAGYNTFISTPHLNKVLLQFVCVQFHVFNQ